MHEDRRSDNTKRLIIGLGKTGWSVARYFKKQGLTFRAIDTRSHPPDIQEFKHHFPETPIHIGSINFEWIQNSHEIILSPGIDPNLIPSYATSVIYSDLDLFNQISNAPIIAITGSNGKSTVTVLIEHILGAAGYRTQTGGNLGIPVLDLFLEPAPDFYILELSSFQLSITKQLKTTVSLFLNFATDHLERHQQLIHYYKAKQKIYRNCQIGIWNRDDIATYPEYKIPKLIDFGSNAPVSEEGFGLVARFKNQWLAQGKTLFFNTQSLEIQGTHNYLNTLAALAAVRSVIDAPFTSLCKGLGQFKGLPHRLEQIDTKTDVRWINDSKATNSHATRAALTSFSIKDQGKVILIAGGVHKDRDTFDVLTPLLKKYIKQFVLIGQDALILRETFKGIAPIHITYTLKEAVQVASNYANSGDTILFSPGCSSQDMFADYVERGECFREEVKLTLHSDKLYD